MAFPVDVVIPVLNHLLAGNAWAAARLAPYAGQAFRVEGGPIPLVLAIVDGGSFASPDDSALAPAVTIVLDSGTLGELLTDPARALASAHLSGSAHFAEALAFVFRNLRWDYEADLADVIGDMPARRLARWLGDFAVHQRRMLGNLGANAAEYLTEEAGLVTPARDVAQFAVDVDALRDDVARLEKRIALLGH